MSDLQFNEDNSLARMNAVTHAPKPSKMVTFLINKGIAKDIKSATRILLIAAGAFFILSIFFFMRVLGGPGTPADVPVDALPAGEEMMMEEI